MTRATLLSGVLALLLLAVHSPAATDTAAPAVKDTPERRHALDLFDHFKMAEAYPLLQKLAEENPTDVVLWERCGVAMVSYSQTIADPAQRKLARAKAREILLKAKALGDDSNILKTLLPMLPEDGGEVSYSPKKEINDIMEAAEADFGRGDLAKALVGYQQALVLDPKLYDAALFSGDACFKMDDNTTAGEWYARAISIDPDRETAYRYWGDSLMAEGRMDEARSKFIEAIVAEPYADRPWTGLSQWADKNNVKLTFLKLRQLASMGGDKSTINMNLDSGDDTANAAWLAYAAVGVQWQTETFKKTFPAEPAYRHSLPEETDALHTMTKILTELGETNKKKPPAKKEPPLDPTLAKLIEIDNAGLLQPYILFERADEGIAKDYLAYRTAHRDLLRRFLDEFVVPKTPKAPR